MKDFLNKIWDKFVEWLLGIPQALRLHFVAGIIIAAFFAIALGMKFCFWPVLFVAFIKEFMDMWFNDSGFDVRDFVATLLGALVPQLFVLLNIWWL